MLVFFDDIRVYNKTLKDHAHHLATILQSLKSNMLCIKRSKCTFASRRVEYLDHFISDEGVATDPRKIEAVKYWPTPKTIKKLRGFLGLTGYYMRFVQGYGVISKSLTELLKKDAFSWSK